MSLGDSSTEHDGGSAPERGADPAEPADRRGRPPRGWCRTAAAVGAPPSRHGDRALRGIPVAATALLATVFLGPAVGAVASPRTAVPAAVVPPCSVEIRPDTLTIRHRPARVLVRIPGGLGEVEGVDASDASGVEVLEVEADAAGGAWIVRLDLSDARAGQWTLAFRGSEGSCRGKMTTRMPGQGVALAEAGSRTRRPGTHETNERGRT